MHALTTDSPAEAPIEVIQPCSEACAGFRRLAGGDGWSDYGICTNPQSPTQGFPARIGHECHHYLPREEN